MLIDWLPYCGKRVKLSTSLNHEAEELFLTQVPAEDESANYDSAEEPELNMSVEEVYSPPAKKPRCTPSGSKESSDSEDDASTDDDDKDEDEDEKGQRR